MPSLLSFVIGFTLLAVLLLLVAYALHCPYDNCTLGWIILLAFFLCIFFAFIFS